MKNNVADLIKLFDKAHIVKQIILIGEDGVTRNIELEFVDDDDASSTEEEGKKHGGL